MIGFTKSMEYARYALEQNIIPVISSSFESAFGLLTLAAMAAVINSDKLDIPVGLDTIDWFDDNLIDDKIIIENAKIDLSRHVFVCENLNFDLLDEITGG